jgi:neutral trehalase
VGANNVNKERMRNENYRRTPTRRPFARPLSMILFVAVGFLPVEALQAKPGAGAEGLDRILNYISTGWDTLTRSMTNCNTVVDPKLTEASLLYLPAHFPVSNALLDLRKRCHVEIRELPARITGPGQVTTNITPPGLLYLENSYVVPGGRFNEMYGWDSYFIIRGLIEGQAHRACPRHGGELLLRARALRNGLERQPYLLPHSLPTALSDLDDYGRVSGRKG